MKKCKLCDSLIEQDICDFCGANNEGVPEIEVETPEIIEEIEIVENMTEPDAEENFEQNEVADTSTDNTTEIPKQEEITKATTTDTVAELPKQEELTDAPITNMAAELPEQRKIISVVATADKKIPTQRNNNKSLLLFAAVILLIATIVFIFSYLQERANPDDDSAQEDATSEVATADTDDPEDSTPESPLLGIWGGGHGSDALILFQEAQYIEFSEDGTLLIIYDGFGSLVIWESDDEDGSFISDDLHFLYTLDDDTLIVEDSSNNQWTFYRADSLIDYIAVLTIADIVGTWEWDDDQGFIYAFNEDGTAVRGFADLRFDFNWELSAENVIYMHMRFEDSSMTERWLATVEGDVLTISDLDYPYLWQYNRTQNEFDTNLPITDSELLGRWIYGYGASLLWFSDTPEVVEFLEDGTISATLGGVINTNRWRPGTSNRFTSDGLVLTYQIHYNQLTITDVRGYSRTFVRD